MNEPITDRRRPWLEESLWAGALLLLCAYLGVMLYTGRSPVGHSAYDSFTRIALAWRSGSLWLPEDCPWLELAIYNGHYYVSFPSVPALVMLPLTLVFGGQTPDNAVVFLYLLGTYLAARALARRYRDAIGATTMALMMTLGCNLFACCMDGGVWYQAQLLSLLLMTLFALGITSDTPLSWGIGLFCLALSVGCRPFQAVFVPYSLYRLYRNLRASGSSTARELLRRAIPLLIAPALVAVLLGWYNLIRFGDPLEFGHNYLPEFTRDPETPQLGLQYVLTNLKEILRMPHMEDGRLCFEKFNGCAFWLLNPIFIAAAIRAVLRLRHREWDLQDTLLTLCLAAEFFLLLIHKTFGGYQFGTRYLCDLVPMLGLFTLRGRGERHYAWETPLCVFAVAINIYGAVWFWTL